jgi:hypothetical protein
VPAAGDGGAVTVSIVATAAAGYRVPGTQRDAARERVRVGVTPRRRHEEAQPRRMGSPGVIPALGRLAK